jgi:hypothetical protein
MRLCARNIKTYSKTVQLFVDEVMKKKCLNAEDCKIFLVLGNILSIMDKFVTAVFVL